MSPKKKSEPKKGRVLDAIPHETPTPKDAGVPDKDVLARSKADAKKAEKAEE